MYSRLNVLVNEINSLGVKKIEEMELIRKMLHTLRKPDYDLVTTILYEKDLSTMTPNQVLNKVTTHYNTYGLMRCFIYVTESGIFIIFYNLRHLRDENRFVAYTQG